MDKRKLIGIAIVVIAGVVLFKYIKGKSKPTTKSLTPDATESTKDKQRFTLGKKGSTNVNQSLAITKSMEIGQDIPCDQWVSFQRGYDKKLIQFQGDQRVFFYEHAKRKTASKGMSHPMTQGISLETASKNAIQLPKGLTLDFWVIKTVNC